jgi:eukaryotic-like serine/threonine-protein kinase
MSTETGRIVQRCSWPLTSCGRLPTRQTKGSYYGQQGAQCSKSANKSGWGWIRSDGSGQPQQLLGNLGNPRPFSLAPTGRLAIAEQNEGLPVIYTVPIDLSELEHPKAQKKEPFLVDPTIVQVAPAFSPDGKFLAYASTESGPNEIFVRPFPGPGGKWKVSQSGGRFPVWSRTAHELLFLGGDDHIMAVDYSTQGDLFHAGKPRVWSPVPVRSMGLRQNFDLSPDGKRVVMFPQPESQESLHFTFLLNFFDEVRRKAPANGKSPYGPSRAISSGRE